MKKIVIILSIFALIANSCGQTMKKQKVAKDILPIDTIKTIISDTSENTNTSNIDCEDEILTVENQYNFENFPTKIYKGKLLSPDFNNNPYASEMGFVESMTDACESEGINFGGHFTILQGSCGCCCSFIIMVDRKNGQFITVQNPNGYDGEDGAFGYEYRKNSNLLIANSTLFIDDKYDRYCNFMGSGLKPKYYVWKENKFVLLK